MITFSNESAEDLFRKSFNKKVELREEKRLTVQAILNVLTSTSSSPAVRKSKWRSRTSITLQPKFSEKKWYELSPPTDVKHYKFELMGNFRKKEIAVMLDMDERTINSHSSAGYLYAQKLRDGKFHFWFASKDYVPEDLRNSIKQH